MKNEYQIVLIFMALGASYWSDDVKKTQEIYLPKKFR